MQMLLSLWFQRCRPVSLITKRSTICVTGSSPNWTKATDTDEHILLTGGGESHRMSYVWQHEAKIMAYFIALSSISCLIRHTLPLKNILFLNTDHPGKHSPL